jgi:hypothetical protein
LLLGGGLFPAGGGWAVGNGMFVLQGTVTGGFDPESGPFVGAGGFGPLVGGGPGKGVVCPGAGGSLCIGVTAVVLALRKPDLVFSAIGGSGTPSKYGKQLAHCGSRSLTCFGTARAGIHCEAMIF